MSVREKLKFATWLDLYNFLRREGLDGQDRVKLMPPRPPRPLAEGPGPEVRPVSVDVAYVKEQAFQELYDSLPTEESLSVLLEITREIQKLNKDGGLVLGYLNKQKTRVR